MRVLIFLFIFSKIGLGFSDKIGLLIVATGKYISFVEPLIQSADIFFCKNHDVTYFVFTDAHKTSSSKIKYIYQNKLGWPFDTMMRYQIYLSNEDLLKEQDYLFSCDADMLFAAPIGNEILGDRIAVQHPGFYQTRGTYEENPESRACVFPGEGKFYFAGGFYGGSVQEFFRIARINAQNINEDYSKGIIAIWHDESHWNRYCIDNEPTVILSPSYCYPEGWNLPFEKKLVALNKNHQQIRGDDP